jgi:signal transduction histidine kinase
VAPLVSRGEPIGAVVLADGETERRFTAAEVHRVVPVASALAAAVTNARLFAEERRRVEQLRHLLEVGRAITASLDLEQILEAAAGALVRMIEAASAHVFLLDPERPVLRGAATSVVAHRDWIRNTEIPLDGRSASARAIALRAPVAVHDTTDPRAEVQHQLTLALGEKSILAVPLLVRDRPIGVVVIGDARDRGRWTSGEVERASLVAHQLAVAVANARLYEDLRRSYAELARAQEELLKRERLAALGELSAVVAHEVRNPLGVIYNAMGPLRRLLRPEGDAKTLLDIVGEEAERLNRIVSDLLDFARPHEPALEEASLAGLLDELLARVKGDSAARRVAFAIDLADLPPIPMDAGMIRRAFLNVVQNAVQATPEGGTVRITGRADEDGVTVEIADPGPGVPGELREKIFQPFFTTKAEGTGLGLAVVKRIVEAHRGRVQVTSTPGGGATFTVRLPRRAP